MNSIIRITSSPSFFLIRSFSVTKYPQLEHNLSSPLCTIVHYFTTVIPTIHNAHNCKESDRFSSLFCTDKVKAIMLQLFICVCVTALLVCFIVNAYLNHHRSEGWLVWLHGYVRIVCVCVCVWRMRSRIVITE